jgi:uncharacterized protein (DUF779 family)
VLLGKIAVAPFYMGAAQFEYWAHTQLTINVVSGHGSGFCPESHEGVRFLTRSRLSTGEEWSVLSAEWPLPTGVS